MSNREKTMIYSASVRQDDNGEVQDPPGRSKIIFWHGMAFESDELDGLEAGTKVTFDIEEGKAVNVRPLQDEPGEVQDPGGGLIAKVNGSKLYIKHRLKEEVFTPIPDLDEDEFQHGDHVCFKADRDNMIATGVSKGNC